MRSSTMKRLIILIPLLLFACGTTPAAPPSEPAANPAPSTIPAECPPSTDACMNEDNHAECLAVAKKCPGKVVQLESCPLQFACDN